jgi:hypothetical protein
MAPRGRHCPLWYQPLVGTTSWCTTRGFYGGAARGLGQVEGSLFAAAEPYPLGPPLQSNLFKTALGRAGRTTPAIQEYSPDGDDSSGELLAGA